MSDIFQTDKYIIDSPPVAQGGGGGGGGEGHVYDLEMDSTNENVTLTEDGDDKTTLPLVPIFTRTKAEWDLMTVAEKTKYRITIFSDDSSQGDISNSSVAFTSSDTTDANATSWTSVTKLTSGLALKELFARVSQMFKNVRYLYKILGNTDISSIGNGTVTDILDTLNSSLSEHILGGSTTYLHTEVFRKILNNTVSSPYTYTTPSDGLYCIMRTGSTTTWASTNINGIVMSTPISRENQLIWLKKNTTINCYSSNGDSTGSVIIFKET